jgi:hypothetical protein
MATKPMWMSGTSADDDPMVLVASKRIRAFRKKLDKIEKLEALVVQAEKNLTDEQKQLLGSKPAVLAVLQEYSQPILIEPTADKSVIGWES